MREQAPLSLEVSSLLSRITRSSCMVVVYCQNKHREGQAKEREPKERFGSNYFGTEKKTCLAQDIGTSFAACCLHDQGPLDVEIYSSRTPPVTGEEIHPWE